MTKKITLLAVAIYTTLQVHCQDTTARINRNEAIDTVVIEGTVYPVYRSIVNGRSYILRKKFNDVDVFYLYRHEPKIKRNGKN